MIQVVYCVLWSDRHTDTDVTVFDDADSAVEWASRQASEAADLPEDLDETLTEAMQDAGWIYHATYSCEGDSLWVLPKPVFTNFVAG